MNLVKFKKKIEIIDKGIVYGLKVVIVCVIRDYLKLYNEENLKAAYPTVHLKALYPDKILNEDWLEQRGTPEELDKWTAIVEETAKNFEKLLSDWAPECQEAVDVAFDSLKKIFLGLWT